MMRSRIWMCPRARRIVEHLGKHAFPLYPSHQTPSAQEIIAYAVWVLTSPWGTALLKPCSISACNTQDRGPGQRPTRRGPGPSRAVGLPVRTLSSQPRKWAQKAAQGLGLSERYRNTQRMVRGAQPLRPKPASLSVHHRSRPPSGGPPNSACPPKPEMGPGGGSTQAQNNCPVANFDFLPASWGWAVRAVGLTGVAVSRLQGKERLSHRREIAPLTSGAELGSASWAPSAGTCPQTTAPRFLHGLGRMRQTSV